MTSPFDFSIITIHHGLANPEDPVIKAVASLASQQEVKSEHLFHHVGGEKGVWNKLFREAALGNYKKNYTLRLLEEKAIEEKELLARGMARATGAIIGFLNPEEEYMPGTFKALQEAFEKHPEVDLFITAAQERGTKQKIVDPLFLEYLWTSDHRPLVSTLFFRASLLKEGFLLKPEEGEMAFLEWLRRLFEAKKCIQFFPYSALLLSAPQEKVNLPLAWQQLAPLGMRLLKPWWSFRYQRASKKARSQLSH